MTLYVRNSYGEMVVVNTTNIHNDKSLYNILWLIKYNKVISPIDNSKTVSVNKMKHFLGSKCFSI